MMKNQTSDSNAPWVNVLNTLRYQTERTIEECIREILRHPQEYVCDFGTPLWYKAETVSENALYITFCGGQFRKMMRTRYLAEFVSEGGCTEITLRFSDGLLGLGPMTPLMDIDRFMLQKAAAVRVG